MSRYRRLRHSFDALQLALLVCLPMTGCLSAPNPNQSLLPPSWTSPTMVASAPPVVYEQAVQPLPPRSTLPVPAPSGPIPGPGPVVSSPEPAMFAPVLPPQAPPADFSCGPDAETRALIDELNNRLLELEQQLQRQQSDLGSARAESAAARETAESLATEMEAWRRELALVQEAFRQQQAADLEALDALNQTLQDILGATAEAGESSTEPLPPAAALTPTRGVTR